MLFFSIASLPALRLIQPSIQWAPETLFPVVKQLGSKTEHSSLSNA
jgi:hypothetical protein